MRYIHSFVHSFNTFTDWTLLSSESIKCTNSQLNVEDGVHLISPPSWFSLTIIQPYCLYKTPSSNDTSFVYIQLNTTLSQFLFYFFYSMHLYLNLCYIFIRLWVCSLSLFIDCELLWAADFFFFFGLPLFKKSIIIC